MIVLARHWIWRKAGRLARWDIGLKFIPVRQRRAQTVLLTMAESEDGDSHVAAAGNHKPGSIQKMVLKNFLTYKDVVIKPGARYVSCFAARRLSCRPWTRYL